MIRANRCTRAACLAAVVLAPAVLTGCGHSDDRAAVRATAERFFNAYDANQGDVACAALSQE